EPSSIRRSLVRTKAPPLPGLTCWNSRILKIFPSISTSDPFLNWFVETCMSGAYRGRPADASAVGEHPAGEVDVGVVVEADQRDPAAADGELGDARVDGDPVEPGEEVGVL